MNEARRPIGIVRTLPTHYGDPGLAKEAFEDALANLASGDADHFYVFLSQKPKHDVAYLYILVEGLVRVRVNIAGYRDGRVYGSMRCWDGARREARWMVICTAPVVYPTEPVKMRGFQGFRYVYGELF